MKNNLRLFCVALSLFLCNHTSHSVGWIKDKIIKPAEKKIIEPLKKDLDSLNKQRCEAAQHLKDGGEKIATLAQELSDGINHLQQVPEQLTHTTDEISKTIKEIDDHREELDEKKQFIISKNLGSLGLADLQNNLINGIDALAKVLSILADEHKEGLLYTALDRIEALQKEVTDSIATATKDVNTIKTVVDKKNLSSHLIKWGKELATNCKE
ncbi:MAG: hypothetical protein WBQ73_00635 [Candidatus Babeliales bacterium]